MGQAGPALIGEDDVVVLGDLRIPVVRVVIGRGDARIARTAGDRDERADLRPGRPLDRERDLPIGPPGLKWSRGTASVTQVNRLFGQGWLPTNLQLVAPADGDEDAPGEGEGRASPTHPARPWRRGSRAAPRTTAAAEAPVEPEGTADPDAAAAPDGAGSWPGTRVNPGVDPQAATMSAVTSRPIRPPAGREPSEAGGRTAPD